MPLFTVGPTVVIQSESLADQLASIQLIKTLLKQLPREALTQ